MNNSKKFSSSHNDTLELALGDESKDSPTSAPLVFKIGPSSTATEESADDLTTPTVVGPGLPLVELLLVLSIVCTLAIAAFIIFPQVQNAKRANEFTQHVSKWSNSGTLLSEDEYFTYQTTLYPDKTLQEVRVFSKEPKGYGRDLLGSVYRKFNHLEADLNQANSTQGFQKIGLAPQSDCLIDVHLTQVSMTWEFEKGCQR